MAADKDFTPGGDVLAELMTRLGAEIGSYIAQQEPHANDLPSVARSRDLDKADFTVQWSQFCASRKKNPVAYVQELAAGLQAHIESSGGTGLIIKVAGVGPYLNLFVDRARVFGLTIRAVAAMGDKFGHTNAAGGRTVIIEHTSSNPNAPLHIGNLRNVMIGAHLAKMQAACGWDVKQVFYVNDLGAQIGLTALAYSRIYDKIKPYMKIDHWIGAMYAVMNTCQELQNVGVDPGKLEDACKVGKEAVDALMAESLAAAAGDEKRTTGVNEYFDIYQDLRERFEPMMVVMIADVRQIDNIKVEGGKLNLAYERQEPWAIKIFRKMVVDCLTGVQQTLSTYGVQHDQFDFESELGWEGSNQKMLEIMKNSDYFVPQTQKNDKGVPQGAYLDMTGFIQDMGFKTGKGGYQKEYPPLYVLRPDGSTLYTYRDIVYSFKKASQADLILNIICSEQELAQQKVSLAMYMMNPEMRGRQYHLSYDLVKLTTGKMSGRRGRYLLADDLYDELKEVIKEKMAKKYKDKGEEMSPEQFEAVTHEVSTAAMKYALLSVGCLTQINFDIAKITDFEDASAPFILYNSTRVASVVRKFEGKVAAGVVPALPALDAIDLPKLDHKMEWAILMEFVLPFASMITDGASPTLPMPPALPGYGTHKVCDFLNSMVRALSAYYGPNGVRILPMDSQLEAGTWDGAAAMHARIHLCKAFKQVIDNGLRLLMIEPLERM
eukprot:CAMPEP_0197614138 /NCGR_PEP_ID=MMETSP1326-20131121/59372_1 /TAXON_ID=1155430 /ORGANISM="Genus nov. species nov., Strain RCC2288" /LENGTH=718 /DNA_ID=CAMNT_0043183007 /DNA_START=37 /DNA_END=2193 /DNA_ORIENTATION=-